MLRRWICPLPKDWSLIGSVSDNELGGIVIRSLRLLRRQSLNFTRKSDEGAVIIWD